MAVDISAWAARRGTRWSQRTDTSRLRDVLRRVASRLLNLDAAPALELEQGQRCPCCGHRASVSQARYTRLDREGMEILLATNQGLVRVSLTPRETQLCWELVKAGGKPVRTATLAVALGLIDNDARDPEMHIVRVNMTRIRRKLETRGIDSERVIPCASRHPGVGYAWAALWPENDDRPHQLRGRTAGPQAEGE